MKSSRYGLCYVSYVKSPHHNPPPAFFAANGEYESVFSKTYSHPYFKFGTL